MTCTRNAQYVIETFTASSMLECCGMVFLHMYYRCRVFFYVFVALKTNEDIQMLLLVSATAQQACSI